MDAASSGGCFLGAGQVTSFYRGFRERDGRSEGPNGCTTCPCCRGSCPGALDYAQPSWRRPEAGPQKARTFDDHSTNAKAAAEAEVKTLQQDQWARLQREKAERERQEREKTFMQNGSLPQRDIRWDTRPVDFQHAAVDNGMRQPLQPLQCRRTGDAGDGAPDTQVPRCGLSSGGAPQLGHRFGAGGSELPAMQTRHTTSAWDASELGVANSSAVSSSASATPAPWQQSRRPQYADTSRWHWTAGSQQDVIVEPQRQYSSQSLQTMPPFAQQHPQQHMLPDHQKHLQDQQLVYNHQALQTLSQHQLQQDHAAVQRQREQQVLQQSQTVIHQQKAQQHLMQQQCLQQTLQLPSRLPVQVRLQQEPGFTSSICPTPFALGPVCARGERELPNWRRCPNSAELLGTYAGMMGDTANFIFNVLGHRREASGSLRLLSAADGCSDDTQPDMQAQRVPTSVMLAHVLASSNGVWHDGRSRVHILGGDVRNPSVPWWQPQQFPWVMPQWVDHRFVALDNTQDFVQQLYSTAQCQADMLFDVVLARQGFCFCDDPSKMSPWWPPEVIVSMANPLTCCGTYALEPTLFDGRPQYRMDKCLLQWSQARVEWAVLDMAGGTWSFARGDVGHPALARGPWAVWSGTDHVNDASFLVSLPQSDAPPPWQRPPNGRVCCCGIPGDSFSLLHMLRRVASVLDTRHKDSFGLLHGAWTNGTMSEVESLHQQLEDAVTMYNKEWRGPHLAAVLWRTAAKEYWLQCDGVILFQPGSRADPYKLYAGVNYEACFGSPSSL